MQKHTQIPCLYLSAVTNADHKDGRFWEHADIGERLSSALMHPLNSSTVSAWGLNAWAGHCWFHPVLKHLREPILLRSIPADRITRCYKINVSGTINYTPLKLNCHKTWDTRKKNKNHKSKNQSARKKRNRMIYGTKLQFMHMQIQYMKT